MGGVEEWRAGSKELIGLLEYYVDRTPGSTLEDMEASDSNSNTNPTWTARLAAR